MPRGFSARNGGVSAPRRERRRPRLSRRARPSTDSAEPHFVAALVELVVVEHDDRLIRRPRARARRPMPFMLQRVSQILPSRRGSAPVRRRLDSCRPGEHDMQRARDRRRCGWRPSSIVSAPVVMTQRLPPTGAMARTVRRRRARRARVRPNRMQERIRVTVDIEAAHGHHFAGIGGKPRGVPPSGSHRSRPCRRPSAVAIDGNRDRVRHFRSGCAGM